MYCIYLVLSVPTVCVYCMGKHTVLEMNAVGTGFESGLYCSDPQGAARLTMPYANHLAFLVVV